jgi:hypothetical protein
LDGSPLRAEWSAQDPKPGATPAGTIGAHGIHPQDEPGPLVFWCAVLARRARQTFDMMAANNSKRAV